MNLTNSSSQKGIHLRPVLKHCGGEEGLRENWRKGILDGSKGVSIPVGFRSS